MPNSTPPYEWNYKSRELKFNLLNSERRVIILDFKGIDNIKFFTLPSNTIIYCGDNCDIDAWRNCEFYTGDNCNINLLPKGTFKIGKGCSIHAVDFNSGPKTINYIPYTKFYVDHIKGTIDYGITYDNPIVDIKYRKQLDKKDQLNVR